MLRNIAQTVVLSGSTVASCLKAVHPPQGVRNGKTKLDRHVLETKVLRGRLHPGFAYACCLNPGIVRIPLVGIR
jgi:hypothetical protein